MSQIRLIEKGMNSGTCSGCGARIDWYETPAGKRMPMNGGAVAVRSGNDPATWEPFLVFDGADSHWNTCPQRARFKK